MVIDPAQIDSIYVDPGERFVVSLVVSYAEVDLNWSDDPPYEWVDDRTMALRAAAAALGLTREEGSRDTKWFVYDRETGEMHKFTQEEFEGVPYDPGLSLRHP